MNTISSLSPMPLKTNTSEWRIKRGWMDLRVDAVEIDTSDTKTFTLSNAESGNRDFDFIAGQYLTFRFDDLAAKPLVRSYTMSGSPRQKEKIYFTVKKIPDGTVSVWLVDQLKVGDVLRARGPLGKFCYDPKQDAKDLVMIAAGSGVTPFISIIREFQDRLGSPGAPESMTLVSVFRSPEDIIHRELFKQASKFEGVRIVYGFTRSQNTAEEAECFLGRPTADILDGVLKQKYPSATFMTCGPQGLMDLSKEVLTNAHVAEDRIKFEAF